MLRSLNDLRKYDLHLTDGEMGTVHDFYFDDRVWLIRYLVVDTGRWLPGRRLLISPAAIDRAEWADRKLFLKLTRRQVENSPEIDAHKPVSRQMEKTLADYYEWPLYWGMHGLGGGPVVTHPYEEFIEKTQGQQGPEEAEAEYDRHLRSIKEVDGYHIQAADGEIGHIDDFLCDDQRWIIRYLVADTRNWLPGKKVLLAPEWIKQIKWDEASVEAELLRNDIENSPEFDPAEPVNREYESRLYNYYGRPKYWE